MKTLNKKFPRAILIGSILPIAFVSSAVAATWDGTPVSLNNNPTFNEGLREGFTNTNNDFATPIGSANLGPNFGESLNLRQGQSNFFDPSAGWADNRTWIYSGEIFTGPNGIISIAANNDDTDRFVIDGTVVLQDTAWNIPNAVVVQGLTPNSWVSFDYRVANGAGGAGPSGQNPAGSSGWTGQIGVVMSYDNENNSVNVADYSGGNGIGQPAEVLGGGPTLFRYTLGGGTVPDNITIIASTTVTLSGSATLTNENFLRFQAPAGTTSLTLTTDSADTQIRTLASGLTANAWVDGSTVTFTGSANVRVGQTQDGAFFGNFIKKDGGTGELIFDNAANDLNGTTLQVVNGLVSIKGNNYNPISSLSAPIEMNGPNARLRFGPFGTSNLATTFNNSIIFNQTGTLEHVAPRQDTINGDITVQNLQTLKADITGGTLRVSGSVTAPVPPVGGVSVEKTGAGTFSIGGANSNSVIHSATISAGKLAFSGSTTFTNVPTILPGATLSLNGASGSTYIITTGTLTAPTGGSLELYPSVGTLPTNLTGGTLILDSQHGLNGEFWNAPPNNVAAASGGTFNSLWDPRTTGTPGASTDALTGGVGSPNGTNVPGNGDFTNFQLTFTNLNQPTVTAFSTDNGVQEFNFPSVDPGSPFAVYGATWGDNIQARWSGFINVPTEGVYGFSTTSDDGSALFIDGESVVNNNRFQGMTNRGGSRFMTAGIHEIVFGFYEGGGGAGLQVFLTPPGGTSQFLTNANLLPTLTPAAFTTPINVQQDSTINTAYFAASNTELTIQNNRTLTTTGNQLTVNTLKLRDAGGVYNINTSGTNNVLVAGVIDDNAGAITINKTGTGVLVLDNTTSPQLTNPGSVINLNAGAVGILLQTGGQNPTGAAALNFNGGGLVLSSKGGNQTFNLPTVFGGTNPVLEARKIGSGVVGPVTIALNGNLNIPSGQVLGLKTADNYTMTIGGTADIDPPTVGTLSINGGRVNTITPNAVTGLNIAFGTAAGVAGTFNIRSASPSIISLSGGKTGTANLALGDGTAASTITINQAIDTVFGGNIVGEGTSVASVVKTGPGTLQFTGNGHNFNGLTISGGTLTSNASGLGTGAVVLNGGTLRTISNGLIGEYWNGDGGAEGGFSTDLAAFNAYFAGKGVTTVTAPSTTNGRTNFKFSDGPGLEGGGPDTATYADQGYTTTNNMAVRFSGQIETVAGEYTFRTRSDDGSVLFIDGVKVVNNNFYQGMTTRSGVITLTAGLHTISIGMYEGGGGSGLEVRYTPPGGIDQFLTNDMLFSAGLTATNNVNLQASSTIDPAGGDAVFGTLSRGPGPVLSGLSGNISFSGTTLTGATGGVHEFNKSGSGVLDLGSINTSAAGANATTIRKSGDGNLLMGVPATPQLQNASDVVNVTGGQVIAVSGPGGTNPLGNSSVQLTTGGTIALSTTEALATFPNPIAVNGTGGVSAGNFGGGAVDNAVVTVGSALTVTGANTLTLSARNGYTLNVGAVSGGGGLSTNGGTVNTTGAVNVGPVVVDGRPTINNTYDGALNTNGSLNATTVNIKGGGVLRQTSAYTTTGETTVETNGEFQVNGGPINSNVRLKGGVLRAQTGVTDFGNRAIVADAQIFENGLNGTLHLHNGGLAPNNDGGILNIQLREPDKRADLDGPLAIPQNPAADGAFGSIFQSTEVTGGRTFTAVFFGRLTATEAGIYQFRSGTVDDNGAFWVDLNRNGIFESTGSAGSELLSGMGCCGDGPIGSANLVAGQTYNVAFGVEDTGGQSGYTALFKRPSDAGLINVDPSTQANVWSRADILTGGAIAVETGAELRAARVSDAGVIALTGDNAKLTLNSSTAASDNAGSLTAFAGVALGATTLDLGAQNTLTVGSLSVAPDGTLIKTGGGTLTATTQSLGARVLNPVAPALQVEAGVVNLNGISAFNPDAPTANTGNVVVNGGTLNVNGSISGAVTVNAAGKLGGTGTVGLATVNGIISPGINAGTLTTGTLLLSSTSIFQFQVFDLVNANGDLTLDGTLQVNVAGLSDGTYRLINYTGILTDNTLNLDAAFLALFPGSTISTATANQVNLVVIPEPGAFAALLGGLGLLTGLRRFRRS